MAMQAVPRTPARAAWARTKSRSKKRIVLVGEEYVIENLGLLHLSGVAREEGWDVYPALFKGTNFDEVYDAVRMCKPDLVGLSVWTGAHLQNFEAARRIRALGVPVMIGGPHATYFTSECLHEADWVAKGDAFDIFRHMLRSGDVPEAMKAPEGHFFDPAVKAKPFPLPYRIPMYERYPHLAKSPIKSMMGSIGCPFHCTYCNSPVIVKMYGDFGDYFRTRPIDDLVREAHDILRCSTNTKMIYMQDDIFGFNMKWLAEFAKRWMKEVGLAFHCQLRLELVRGPEGLKRLELLAQAGCTGITLAIESGNDFLRTYVLKRPMDHATIVEGCRRIMSFGLSLRTEQILQLPFADLRSDVSDPAGTSTLALNCEINPTMAWTSHFTPFGGEAEKISQLFRFHIGDKDDFASSFYYERSHLRHSSAARDIIEPLVREIVEREHQAGKVQRYDSPLLRMRTEPLGNHRYAVFSDNGLIQLGNPTPICEIEYLDDDANERYNMQMVFVQRVFNWLAKIHEGEKLGKAFADLPYGTHSWKRLGELTAEHFASLGMRDKYVGWKHRLAAQMRLQADELPPGIRDNPAYFVFFPSSGEFAQDLVRRGTFAEQDERKLFDEIGTRARHWLFNRAVYRTAPATDPIVQR